MLKQFNDESGKPLYDSNGKPLMYESTADEPAKPDEPNQDPADEPRRKLSKGAKGS